MWQESQVDSGWQLEVCVGLATAVLPRWKLGAHQGSLDGPGLVAQVSPGSLLGTGVPQALRVFLMSA